jgi:endonuclease/exonuclease/phosphatase family metal-dependent hydrolase
MAVAAGSLFYLALVLLWSLHIDQPLPVPRQTVPALAALVVATVSLRGVIGQTTNTELGRPASLAIVLGLAVAAPLWLLSGAPRVDEVPVTGSIRLVDYNVRGGVGIDGQLAPDRIVDEILSSDPDIVVVQEAARGWAIHGTMDLVSYLQRHLRMDYVYVGAADGQFGNAVFSKYPMTKIDTGLLPRDGSQKRAYVLVRFDVAGSPLYIAATHLEPRSATQVDALLGVVEGLSPLVVAGDMNIAPGESEITPFSESGFVDVVGATGDECRTTSAEPTSDCDRPDWVFITPDLQIEELRIGSGGSSDHLAIHVTLKP